MRVIIPLYAGLATVIMGLFVEFLAAKVLGEREGRVVGFSATIGILIGSSAGVLRSPDDWWLNALGGLIGLTFLWALWFRKAVRHD